MKFYKQLIILILLLILVGNLSACANDKYPRPTREYYVNDFADVLLPGSRQSIISEGERLYELTKDEEYGGAQIVVATFIAENEDKAYDIDRTELFRQWRIGKNDMGVLVLLVFCELEGDEEEGLVSLVRAEIEIGYRMEQYITASDAAYLLDDCLLNPEWEGSLDMGLGELYYELISMIYIRAYGYESFNYDMEEYREFLINAEEMDTQVPMGLIAYLLSPYSSFWSKFFAILPFAIFFLLSGGLLRGRTRGGGGSSGGYGAGRFR